ncbi:MAG: TatD family hydrolase [Gammaproteobacteria bacterium]|nr:TatD family hydrolase [Gammaproteobacteria bacterium]
MDLIDIGLNLTHDSFDSDREEMMAAASELGVRRCIITGTTVEASQQAEALAAARNDWFATAGIHPHHASELDGEALAALRALLASANVVAVGECGLDFFRNYSSREAQVNALEGQLSIAAETGKPLFLHQREAHRDLLDILRNEPAAMANGAVVHCFTDGPDELRDLLDLGMYVGITGWLCDERRGEALRQAARFLPLDRVMVETDAPYLLPRDLPEKPKGRRNEPRHLPHIVARLAEEMGQPVEAVAAATTRNAETLFRLP